MNKKIKKYKMVDSNLPSYFTIDVNGRAAINGIVQINDGSAPIWEGENVFSTSIGDNISETIKATPVVGTSITYGLIRNQLPFGIELDSKTGQLYGEAQPLLSPKNLTNVQPFYDSQLPTWITNSGVIGSEFEGTEINTTVTAFPNNGIKTFYSVISGNLPFGAELDNATGDINGKLSPIFDPSKIKVEEITPKPRWASPIGLISVLGEHQDYSYQLEALPRKGNTIKYYHISGRLPFGIELLESGKLYGNTGEVLFPEKNETTVMFTPAITTPPNLGTFRVGDTIDIQISAEVYSGRSISHFSLYDKEGFVNNLPFGLELDGKNGRLTGKLEGSNKSKVYPFTVLVYDSVKLFSCRVFTMNIINEDLENEDT